MIAMENFEEVLAAAQASGSLNPAWKKFVNTRFYVAALAPAGAHAGHALRVPAAGQPVRISEVRERVDDGDGGLLAALSGAEVVRLVPAGAAIAVALSARTFEIAGDRVAWLRKSIEASLAKGAQERAAAAAPVSTAAAATPVSTAPAAGPGAAPAAAAPAAAPASPAPVAMGKTERAAAQRRARAASRNAEREAQDSVDAQSAPSEEPDHHDPEPKLFAWSMMRGRVGRMRAMAGGTPLFVALGILTLSGYRLSPQSDWNALALVVAAGSVVVYWMIRLLVLRLHDLNLSGLWLAGVVPLFIGAGFVGGLPLLDRIGTLFWLATAVVCCLIPGTDGPNKHGTAPGPNSTLVKVVAWLFIVANLMSLVLTWARDEGTPARGAPRSGPVWTSPDRAITIGFPVAPYEDRVDANVLQRMGAVRMRQFSAFAHSENYRVQVLELAAAPAEPGTVMLQVQGSLLGRGDVMTVPPSTIALGSYPGRDIKAGKRQIRMVAVGSTVYVVTADADAAPASMARASAFIESLAVRP